MLAGKPAPHFLSFLLMEWRQQTQSERLTANAADPRAVPVAPEPSGTKDGDQGIVCRPGAEGKCRALHPDLQRISTW